MQNHPPSASVAQRPDARMTALVALATGRAVVVALKISAVVIYRLPVSDNEANRLSVNSTPSNRWSCNGVRNEARRSPEASPLVVEDRLPPPATTVEATTASYQVWLSHGTKRYRTLQFHKQCTLRKLQPPNQCWYDLYHLDCNVSHCTIWNVIRAQQAVTVKSLYSSGGCST